MDFKSLITKISSMDDAIETVAAPTLPQSIQLNEDAQLRVLAGTSTILEEAKKAKPDFLDADKDGDKKEPMKKALKDKEVKEEMEVGQSKKTAGGGTVTKTSTGIIHKGKKYGGEEEKSDDSDEDDAPKAKAKKAKKESIDTEAFKGKFAKMVEAKKEETSAEKSKKEEKKKKIAKIMDEAAKPDFLDMDKDGDKKEPMKKAVADKKKGAVKKESTESTKQVVAESVEPKLTFKDMVKLVQESGGQQRIDAKDEALFSWAQRVAAAKFTESAKQEVYAGLVYERMGGVFEMYDVLAEDQK